MLLQPHSSPRSRGGLRASGREEVTLTNKQGGGWCAPRQGAEGVPGGFSRDLWRRRCRAISTAFGSCLLIVSSPGCYAGVLAGIARENVTRASLLRRIQLPGCSHPCREPGQGQPQGADGTGVQPSLRVPEMLL